MFKELIENMKKMFGGRPAFDPSSIGDPMAIKTGWNPIKGGGTNFCTHKLVAVSPERMEFRASLGAKIFFGIFLVVGLAVVIGVSAANISSGNFAFNMNTIFPILFGLVFAAVGGSLLYFGTKPIVFDKRKGFFWKGKVAPDEVFDRNSLKCFAEIENIYALQLISEYCSGNKSSYYSYELNLVLNDGERVNVIDHGNIRKIREDAASLSTFLGKPLWDGI